jgi:hypothetical protein
MRYGVVRGGPSGGEEGRAWSVVLGGTIEPQPEPAQERSVSGVTREKEYDDPNYRSGGSIGGWSRDRQTSDRDTSRRHCVSLSPCFRVFVCL